MRRRIKSAKIPDRVAPLTIAMNVFGRQTKSLSKASIKIWNCNFDRSLCACTMTPCFSYWNAESTTISSNRLIAYNSNNQSLILVWIHKNIARHAAHTIVSCPNHNTSMIADFYEPKYIDFRNNELTCPSGFPDVHIIPSMSNIWCRLDINHCFIQSVWQSHEKVLAARVRFTPGESSTICKQYFLVVV